ncbi:helix-turn-helix domain-containing protein [Arthrobacter sp. CAN_A212]|uniref:helix-turn-helix domain-containing protein n=1 Tax=Arthrobacter sp. CAN_A212 TaxID=2787719 RepID=UPI003FA4702D
MTPRGRTGGRKLGLSPMRIVQAKKMIAAGSYTKQEIAGTFGVSWETLYRHIGGEGIGGAV